MNRIAVCFSGQPRSVEDGFEYYKKNLFDKFDNVDVFIHTWNCVEAEKALKCYGRWVKDYKADKPLRGAESINRKYTHTPDAKKWPPYFTVSAYYSTYECMKMKNLYEVTNMEQPYDWVIKTRFDFALNGVLPFDQMKKGIVYMPDCRRVFGDWLGNDQFAVGNSFTMNKYMSTFMNMEMYYTNGIQMIGEEMLRANLKNYGLVGPNLAYLKMEAPFPPGEYNGTPHFLIRDDMNKWKVK